LFQYFGKQTVLLLVLTDVGSNDGS